jgi:5-methylcytosine-specific restriction endonuclease McrA
VAANLFPECKRCRKKFAVPRSTGETRILVSRSGYREVIPARPIPEYCHRCTRHLMYGRNSRPEPISEAEWQAIIEKHRGRCAYCGVEGKLTQDHNVPVPRGGKSDAANIVPACRLCNSRKGSKTGREYRAWLEKMLRSGKLRREGE